MDFSPRKAAAIESMLSRKRIEDKLRENRSKPPLQSDDVRYTADFVFSRYKPHAEYGDSGPLLLAKQKKGGQIYLVKHAFADCAVNEFVHTKLAQAMDLKMPDAVLFQLSPGEKRRYWKTEYILGTRFLELEIECPTYAQIRERACNWQDYFHFQAMYSMCMEGDSFETPLAADGFIYRVDTADSFTLSNEMLSIGGIADPTNGIIPKDAVRRYIDEYDYSANFENDSFGVKLAKLAKLHGAECIPIYLETFERFLDIRPDYIDSFLNTLCYFYPDFIGDYFKRYIEALADKSRSFLKEMREAAL